MAEYLHSISRAGDTTETLAAALATGNKTIVQATLSTMLHGSNAKVTFNTSLLGTLGLIVMVFACACCCWSLRTAGHWFQLSRSRLLQALFYWRWRMGLVEIAVEQPTEVKHQNGGRKAHRSVRTRGGAGYKATRRDACSDSEGDEEPPRRKGKEPPAPRRARSQHHQYRMAGRPRARIENPDSEDESDDV